jgi:hypothetical protein
MKPLSTDAIRRIKNIAGKKSSILLHPIDIYGINPQSLFGSLHLPSSLCTILSNESFLKIKKPTIFKFNGHFYTIKLRKLSVYF